MVKISKATILNVACGTDTNCSFNMVNDLVNRLPKYDFEEFDEYSNYSIFSKLKWLADISLADKLDIDPKEDNLFLEYKNIVLKLFNADKTYGEVYLRM